jgi:gamma-glutamyl phosphate reductase
LKRGAGGWELGTQGWAGSPSAFAARGPMGLEELTSYKWLGIGTGQVRT